MNNINTLTAAELMSLAYIAPMMFTLNIGCNHVGDRFYMFDLSSDNLCDQVVLQASCSTPERLLAHLKGYVANRLAK